MADAIEGGHRFGRHLGKIGLALLAGVIIGGASSLAIRHDGMAIAAPASNVATRYDRAFGNVFYKVPSGYRAVQQSAGVVMARTADVLSGNLPGVLVVSRGLPLTPELRKELREKGKSIFVQGIAIALGNLTADPRAKLSNPAPVNNPAEDGYEAFALNGQAYDSDAGQKRFTTFVVVITPSRVEAFMKVGYGSEANAKALDAGFEALTASAEFRDAGARPPSRLAPPLPTNLAALAPAPARPAAPAASNDESPAPARGGGGGNCRIVQRQMCSGGIGTGLGYFCNTYPQRVCN